MSDVRGAITSISFAVMGGTPFDIAVTGTPGATVTFTSTDAGVVPAPMSGTIAANGSLVVPTIAAPVTRDTTVTITAVSTGSQGETPLQINMLVYVQAG